MRYLSAEPMTLPVEMTEGEDSKPVSLATFAKFLLEAYSPQQNFSLSVAQLRSLNKALDILEGEPDEGHYALDNEEINVIKQVVENLGPKVLVRHARNVPVILDALDAAPEKRPTSPNGVVKEEELAEVN